ncbi:MAG: tetratricopeptide repeat protein [Verrucomicrobiota bacterium]|nr:tetratricopeptide repeat protein [Verrucomicrobiota bacterium]
MKLPGWLQRLTVGFFAGIAALSMAAGVRADLGKAEKDYRIGDYENVAKAATAAIEDKEREEQWRVLLVRSLMNLGRYPEAEEAARAALRRYYYSVSMRILAYDAFQYAGKADDAARMLQEINELGSNRRFGYRDAETQVALGKGAILLGADPKLVLDNFYEPAKKQAKLREAWLAAGQLALDKGDYSLASRQFESGLKEFPDDPDLLWGLAAAFAPSDRMEMLVRLEKALEINKNHTPSLLLLAEHSIDSEDYKQSAELLDRVRKINPHEPKASAFKALLHLLKNENDSAEQSRLAGLKYWTNNAAVDYWIGLKLSHKYRFKEGAERQRQALRFNPDYLPARLQLANDLLRLGNEEQGWQLASQVHEKDAYDVGAYNLVTLSDKIKRFETLTNEHFVLRMDPAEKAVYGKDLLELLEQARTNLCAKYGLTNHGTILVEIFPEQKDFAVRTFGMPGGENYLGVCFGNVITANSPAAQAHSPSNWKAMIWHEFCHVVTLHLTENKMPRWLSEGISVFEERNADPSWGEQINPEYRQMILDGEMAAITNLTSLFMSPKSGLHLQFAYYQSSLVVEYLVREKGIEPLKQLLRDLGRGVPLNDALANAYGDLDRLEKTFLTFAREKAREMGPDLFFKKKSGQLDLARAKAPAINSMPQEENFYALKEKAAQAMEQKKWEEAIPHLQKILQTYPAETGNGSARMLLAECYRELDRGEEERKLLAELSLLDADALPVYLRLIELDARAEKWDSVSRQFERAFAVNPFLPQIYTAAATAAEKTGNKDRALDLHRKHLAQEPLDRAETHYSIARLLAAENREQARFHLLNALEESPRFRKALELLQQVTLQEAN